MSGGARGFTLVEMLVAISVSALLIGLAYGAVVIGQRSVQAVGDHAARSEVARIGWQYLHDAVSRAQPVGNPRDRDDRTGFDGSAEQLVFVADQPAYVGPGGLNRIGLEVRDEGGRDALVLTRQRFDPAADEDAEIPTQEAVLVDDLEELRIAYFGPGEDDAPAAWSSSWQGADVLPSLVEINVKPRGGMAWPVLIARPMAGTRPIEEDQPIDGERDPAQPEETAPGTFDADPLPDTAVTDEA